MALARPPLPAPLPKAPGNTERTPHPGGSGSTPGYLLGPATLPDHRPPQTENTMKTIRHILTAIIFAIAIAAVAEGSITVQPSRFSA